MIEAEGGDSSGNSDSQRPHSESRHEERLLRPKAIALGAQGKGALISAKNAEIRQIEPFAVRLAEAVPAESVRSERKSTGLKEIELFQWPPYLKEIFISTYIAYY